MSIFIIAEIGINHNGRLENALRLVDAAQECGADAVKFQRRTVALAYTKEFLDSPRESPWGSTQRDQKEGLELTEQDYIQIDHHCRKKGIEWFASTWDLKSYEFLRTFNLRHNKIASAMLTSPELLRAVAADGRHTFISTGMGTATDIDRAVNMFRAAHGPFELMHCVSMYPTPDKDAHLEAVPDLKDRYGCDVGYSGHEVGLAVSFRAVALGITSLERHITLDRRLYGSDQGSSLEPSEFRALVSGARRIRDGSATRGPSSTRRSGGPGFVGTMIAEPADI